MDEVKSAKVLVVILNDGRLDEGRLQPEASVVAVDGVTDSDGRVEVMVDQVTPLPPATPADFHGQLKPGSHIDLYDSNGWWSGEVTAVVSRSIPRKQVRDWEEGLLKGPAIERCKAALELLAHREDAYWFLEPVGLPCWPCARARSPAPPYAARRSPPRSAQPRARRQVPVEDVPDYLEIVPKPMDFGTIRGKLEGSEYEKKGDDQAHLRFSADVRLVFTNAIKYNFSAEHPCHQAARGGLRSFDAYFGCVLGTSDSLPTKASSSAATPGAATGKKQRRMSEGAGPGSSSGGAKSSGGGHARSKVVMRPTCNRGGAPDDPERDAALIRALGEYVEACGGAASDVDGWYTKTEVRKEGNTAGTFDTYFFTPQAKRFRSKAEVARCAARSAPSRAAPHRIDASARRRIRRIPCGGAPTVAGTSSWRRRPPSRRRRSRRRR